MKVKSVPIKVLDCDKKPVWVLAVRRIDFGLDDIFVLHRAIPYKGRDVQGWNVTHAVSGRGVLSCAQSSMSKAIKASRDKIDSVEIEKLKKALAKYRKQRFNSKESCEKCQKLSLYSLPSCSDEDSADEPTILAVGFRAPVDGAGLPVEIIEKCGENNTVRVRVKDHKSFTGSKTLHYNMPRGKAIHYQKNELAGFEFCICQEYVVMLPKSKTKAI